MERGRRYLVCLIPDSFAVLANGLLRRRFFNHLQVTWQFCSHRYATDAQPTQRMTAAGLHHVINIVEKFSRVHRVYIPAT